MQDDEFDNKVKPKLPDLDGYLYKLKHKNSLFGSWVKRYWRINKLEEALEYYTSKNDDSPQEKIPLQSIQSVDEFDATSFQIVAKHKSYLLKADSNAECICWVQGLNLYVRHRQAFDRNAESIR